MSIEPPRDQWQPTSHLRWNLGGKLQQMWWREVSEYSTYWKRTLWKPEYEWREVPTEQPAQETRALCPHGMPLAENVCGPCSEGRPNSPAVNRCTVCGDPSSGQLCGGHCCLNQHPR